MATMEVYTTDSTDYLDKYGLLGKYYVKKTDDGYLFTKQSDIEEYPYLGSHYVILPLSFDIYSNLHVPPGVVSKGKVEEIDERGLRVEELINTLVEELDEYLEKAGIPIKALEGKDMEILDTIRRKALEQGSANYRIGKIFSDQINPILESVLVKTGRVSAPEAVAPKPLNTYRLRYNKQLGRLSGVPVPRKGGRRTRKSKTARKHKRHSRTRAQSKHRK